MEIYIVFNQSERYDSSYYDIVEVFDSEEKAKACIQTCSHDFVLACDNNALEGFKNYEVDIDTLVKKDDCITVRNKDNVEYESWYYESFDVK